MPNKLGFADAPEMPVRYAIPPSPGVPTPEEEALVPQPLGTETNFLSLPLGMAVRGLGLATIGRAEQASYGAAQAAERAGGAAMAAKLPHQAVAVDHFEIENALRNANGALDKAPFNVYARLKDTLGSLAQAVTGRTAAPAELAKLIERQGALADHTLQAAVRGGQLSEEAAQAEGAVWNEQLQALLGQVQ